MLNILGDVMCFGEKQSSVGDRVWAGAGLGVGVGVCTGILQRQQHPLAL